MYQRVSRVPLGLAFLGASLFAGFTLIGSAHAGHGVAYQDAVLADSPILYYQFEEAAGSLQVMDSSGVLNSDGSSRDSQFIGTRSHQRVSSATLNDPFILEPGKGIILGQQGPVGGMVEFNNPDAYKNGPGVGPSTPRGNAKGGYIETGLKANFGLTGNGMGDWSIEFLYRDYNRRPGDNNAEQIVGGLATASLPPGVTESMGETTVGPGPIDYLPPQYQSVSGAPSIFTVERNPGSLGNPTPEFATFYGQDRTYAGEQGLTATTDAQWKHIVLTFDLDGANSRLRWYINGVLTATEFPGAGFSPDTDSPMILGAAPIHYGRQYFDGFMDEFAVYDKRLDDPNNDGDMSDSRILPHFNALNLYTVIDGDFNGDGNVNGADFLRWQQGESPNQEFQTGAVSAGDLADWGANFGAMAPAFGAAAAAVPEPSSLLLACTVALSLAARRRRKRCA